MGSAATQRFVPGLHANPIPAAFTADFQSARDGFIAFLKAGMDKLEGTAATSLRNVDDEVQRNYLIAKKLRIERRISAIRSASRRIGRSKAWAERRGTLELGMVIAG